MSIDTSTPEDDRVVDLLAACDDALAVGQPPASVGSDVGLSEIQEVDRGLACIKILRDVLGNPARHAAMAPREDRPAKEPCFALPFQQLGRFQIRRKLGQGSYGIVFLAYDPHLRRDVALKVPRGEPLLTPSLRERFLREARAAAVLNHPNIIAVHEAGEVGPVCFIAAEYCPGVTLADWLKGRTLPVPVRDAAGLMLTVAEAVHHAHERGVVHRDLKPSNIMLQASGNCEKGLDPDHQLPSLGPKITDFGLAKFFQEEDAGQTQSGAIVGTPQYMAPEQARGQKRGVGPAADVYSLGALLYELLTSRPPFRGETIGETLEQVGTAEPLPPSRLRPNMPPDLQTICLKCLEKEPQRRYAAAAALAADLRHFLDGRPILARPISVAGRAVKWARRQPVVAALTAFLVALGMLSAATIIGGTLWHLAQLEKHNTQLEMQRATQQRLRGEAMDALNGLVFDVQEELAQVPGIGDLRQKLLRRALEGLARVVGDNATADDTTATALLRMGYIQLKLGQVQQARAQFEKARRIAEARTVKEGPAPLNLADAYRGLALCLGQDERPRESWDYLRRAREIAEARVADDPRSLLALETLMNICNDLADTCRALSEEPEARSIFRRSVELGERLPASPSTVAVRQELAYAWETLGELSLDAGDPATARTEINHALELRQALTREFSYHSRNDVDLGLDFYELGRCDLQEGRGTEAEAQLTQAKALLEQQANLDPKRVRVHRFLAWTCRSLGEARLIQGDLDAARAHYRRAVGAVEDHAKEAEGSLIPTALTTGLLELGRYERTTLRPTTALDCFQRALACLNKAAAATARAEPSKFNLLASQARREIDACRSILDEMAALGGKVPPQIEGDGGRRLFRAQALACLGRHAEAATLAGTCAAAASGDPENLYKTAVIYAMCATAVKRDIQASSPVRRDPDAVSRYTTRAIEMIRRARALGFEDVVRLQRDVDLACIRGTHEFHDLLQRSPAPEPRPK